MKLTVKPIKKNHANRSLAAIDRNYLKENDISTGSYIKIEGKKDSAVARVFAGYDKDVGNEIIRIDGHMRQRAGVNIDEKVTIEPIEVKTAKDVVISYPNNINIRGDLAGLLRKKLSSRPIKEGHKLPLALGFGVTGQRDELPLKIEKTNPQGNVVITEDTNIQLKRTSLQSTVNESTSSTDPQSMSNTIAYEDIGGLSKELENIREMVELPMRHPEIFKRLGIDPPKGLLLYGPPGTGKTLMAKAVANEVDADFYTISGPEIMSKYYGESEEKLREVFEDAAKNSPSIIFMDEIDSIASQRGEASGDVERRIVAQLLSLMDGLEERDEVIVIGATNRVNAIDPALRRGGRFDREIEVGVPDRTGRKEILDVHTRSMPISDNVDLGKYADITHGFVGADLEALCKEAAMNSLNRIKPELDLDEKSISAEVLESLEVNKDDFKKAHRDIEPSALREVFVEVPDITWDDVGGLYDIEEKLREIVQWPLQYPTVFEDMKIEGTHGVLLYGPPGTGKTLLAKAVANESDSNFISIKGPELLNKYVGESEKGVREIFSKARENSPTVVFFDEIDAIAGQRGKMGDSGVGERVVSQLLTELDGLENLEDVIVIATTNRPDLIDSALMRPGRLDKHLHVPVPSIEGRKEILMVHTQDKPVSDDVDIDEISEKTEGFVGADLQSLCREATMYATREIIRDFKPEHEDDKPEQTTKEITMEHFNKALDDVNPSVTEDTKEEYKEIENRFENNANLQKDENKMKGRTFY